MKRLLALAPLMLIAACSEAADSPAPADSGTPEAGATAAAPAPTGSGTTGTPTPTATPSPEVAAAIPAAFHGVWDNANAACEPATDARLTIAAKTLQFYESSGPVTRVEIDSPTRIVVSATLSGEGETWQNSYLFELRDGGKTLYSNGVNEEASTPLMRKRCS